MEKIKTIQVEGNDAKLIELEFEAAAWQRPNFIKCRVARKSKTRYLFRRRISATFILENNIVYEAETMMLTKMETQRSGGVKTYIYTYRCGHIQRISLDDGIERSLLAADEDQNDNQNDNIIAEDTEENEAFALPLVSDSNDETP